ncbi:MAG: hypothetical protein EBS39_11205, partial [Gammaproteobacteria bacterium]|nr:hypothetical protein [Gammaproteobacteria bacterium]
SKACVERTQIAARAAIDKFGTELVALDLSDQTVLSEVFLIVTASNTKMIDTIADEVEEKLRLAGDKPLRREVWDRNQLIARWQAEGESFKAEWAAELPEGESRELASRPGVEILDPPPG